MGAKPSRRSVGANPSKRSLGSEDSRQSMGGLSSRRSTDAKPSRRSVADSKSTGSSVDAVHARRSTEGDHRACSYKSHPRHSSTCIDDHDSEDAELLTPKYGFWNFGKHGGMRRYNKTVAAAMPRKLAPLQDAQSDLQEVPQAGEDCGQGAPQQGDGGQRGALDAMDASTRRMAQLMTRRRESFTKDLESMRDTFAFAVKTPSETPDCPGSFGRLSTIGSLLRRLPKESFTIVEKSSPPESMKPPTDVRMGKGNVIIIPPAR